MKLDFQGSYGVFRGKGGALKNGRSSIEKESQRNGLKANSRVASRERRFRSKPRVCDSGMIIITFTMIIVIVQADLHKTAAA